MSIAAGTPTQKGVGYQSTAARTFESGNIVPMSETYTETADGDGEFTTNQEGAWDNFGTSNHRLTVRGDFKLKDGETCPKLGDVLTDGTSSYKWVVSEPPEYKNFNPSTGQPMIVGLVMVYTSAIDAAES